MAKDRSSEALTPTLITDRKKIAEREAENALRQFDASMLELQKWIKSGNYRLKPSTILKLNRYALDGISEYAGLFRPAGVKISGSSHDPVEAAEVPVAVEEMCEYLEINWERKPAVHLAAYVLWRLNWIHPFVDGNGRTARAVAYLVMCAKLGSRLPGKITIPEQIAGNKAPYYRALEDADRYYKIGKDVNVSAMEAMLDSQLAKQLVDVHDVAIGGRSKAEVSKTDKVLKQNLGLGSQVLKTVEEYPVLFGGLFTMLAAIAAIIWAS
jgi:Fic family protein